jgi:uncharacterized protein (DUF433 family)
VGREGSSAARAMGSVARDARRCVGRAALRGTRSVAARLLLEAVRLG